MFPSDYCGTSGLLNNYLGMHSKLYCISEMLRFNRMELHIPLMYLFFVALKAEGEKVTHVACGRSHSLMATGE